MSGTINPRKEAPPVEVINRLEKLPSSILSDVMNRMGCMQAQIKPLSEKVHFCGPAVTVKSMVGDNSMSHYALYVAQKGDVLVIDARGHVDTSVWGMLQTRVAQLRGLSGVVIDGAVRDVLEIRQSRFPLFCKGATPAGPHKGWGGAVNVPIQCGGAAVQAGDLIVGDDDGVVVIPRDSLNEVLIAAEQRLKVEEEWFKRVENGEKTIDILALGKRITVEGFPPISDNSEEQ